MFRICLFVVLALIASANAQGESSASEPYSYGYETESHSASEQKDPSGKVTGFYTIADADGRQRRVDYYADESGFHAKVQTNEVGTKSENSADVEVLASPPNREQFSAYEQARQQQQQQQQQPQQQQPRFAGQQYSAQAPQRSISASYVPQPYGNYQYPGYGNTGGNYGYGANNYGGYSSSSYNNHLPSAYYRSVQATGPPQVSAYSAGAVQPGGAVISRYVSSPTPVNTGSSGIYRGFQSYGGSGAAGFGNVPAP